MGGQAKLTVTAHDGSNAGHNGSQERVSVDLMLSPVVDLGCRLRSGIFLLVVDPVFGTGLYSGLLQSEDGLIGSLTGQKGITAEAFPVPASYR